MSEKENKKLFGVDVGQYMGDFGQVRKMNVGREAEATKQNLVSTYSGMSNEAKRIYREKVQSMADQGNPAAINTMNALKENNVISGDWSFPSCGPLSIIRCSWFRFILFFSVVCRGSRRAVL